MLTQPVVLDVEPSRGDDDVAARLYESTEIVSPASRAGGGVSDRVRELSADELEQAAFGRRRPARRGTVGQTQPFMREASVAVRQWRVSRWHCHGNARRLRTWMVSVSMPSCSTSRTSISAYSSGWATARVAR